VAIVVIAIRVKSCVVGAIGDDVVAQAAMPD